MTQEKFLSFYPEPWRWERREKGFALVASNGKRVAGLVLTNQRHTKHYEFMRHVGDTLHNKQIPCNAPL